MATHTDTKKLVEYLAGNYPTLGNPERFISNELGKIAKSLNSITTMLRLMETRMNDNGLS